MQLSGFIGIKKLADLVPDKFNRTILQIFSSWDSHDTGQLAFSNISFGIFFKSISSAYSITNTDQAVLVNCTSGAVTVTLPNANGINGKIFYIKDWKGQSATHTITIATTSSQTIDGSSTQTLTTNYQAIEVMSDGANWSIISNK